MIQKNVCVCVRAHIYDYIVCACVCVFVCVYVFATWFTILRWPYFSHFPGQLLPCEWKNGNKGSRSSIWGAVLEVASGSAGYPIFALNIPEQWSNWTVQPWHGLTGFGWLRCPLHAILMANAGQLLNKSSREALREACSKALQTSLQMAHPAVCMACYLYHLKIAYLEDRLSRPEVDAVIYSIMQCERFNYDKVTKSRETAPERSQK